MKLAVILLALGGLVGCSQSFYVESDPPGADVWIGGKYKGVTPCSCSVTGPGRFSRPIEVKVKKEGYLPANAFTDWGWTWYLTYEWNQTRYYLKLHKLEAPATAEKPAGP